MRAGTVTGARIGKKGESTTDVVILTVEFTGPDDTDDVEWIPAPGEDSTPQLGSRVIVHSLASGYLVAGIGNDGATQTSDAGEKEIYSCDDSGVKAARIKAKADGTVAVANTVHELKDLIDDLFDKIDAIQTYGSPASHTLTASTKAAFTTLKAEFDALFGTT